jgi:hypothetical protein
VFAASASIRGRLDGLSLLQYDLQGAKMDLFIDYFTHRTLFLPRYGLDRSTRNCMLGRLLFQVSVLQRQVIHPMSRSLQVLLHLQAKM